MSKVSIILHHHHTRDYSKNERLSNIERLFQSFGDNSLGYDDYEILFLTDGSEYQNQCSRMQIVPIEYESFGQQANELIATMNSELLILMYSDISIDTGEWLKKIIEFLDIAPANVGIIGFKQLSSEKLIHSYGNWIIHPKGYHHIGHEMPAKLFTQPIECDTVSDAFFVFKRQVFEDVGGFDTTLSESDQIIDFILNARMKGYRIMAIPDVEYINWHIAKDILDIRNASESLEEKHQSFNDKWGFDYLHPDMQDVIQDYQGTNLLWNMRWLKAPYYDKYQISGPLHWDWYFNENHPGEIERVNLINLMVEGEDPLRILDIGCGDGLYSHFLALRMHRVVGLDYNPEGIKWAVKKTAQYNYPKTSPHFLCGSCYEFPFDDHSFDRAFCFDLIEHLNNPIQMLREVWRVLIPGGMLFISTPRKIFHDMHDRAYHITEYTFQELANLVSYVFKDCMVRPWRTTDLICIAEKPEDGE